MIAKERILFCVVFIFIFSSKVIANCIWRGNDYPNYYENSPCRSEPYTVECESVVNYRIAKCLEPPNTWAWNYNIIVYLQNPDEKPFLQNVTFYTKLSIQGGYLVTIPKEVYTMTKLTNIMISDNKLRKINFNNFLSMPNLRQINLAYNKVIVIETEEKLDDYSSVQDIDISYNLIETVPNNFIKKYKELAHLNMSHNLISTIDNLAFEGTTQLKTLDLSHNKLKEVGNIFVQLPKLYDPDYETNFNLQKLTTLVLDYNSITNINFTEFFETGIPELSIGDNQISCNSLAKVKYSKFSEKFDRIVRTMNANYYPGNVNGITCVNVENNIDTILIPENPNSNSSILISQLKKSIENNSKSVNSLIEMVNQNEKKLNIIMEWMNLTLTNINQLKNKWQESQTTQLQESTTETYNEDYATLKTDI